MVCEKVQTMFNVRKGITPVIAIVLLILITLGAVGVVWTQFQSVLNFGEQANSQQQAMKTDWTFESVYKDGGNINMTVRNPTDDLSYNTSQFTLKYRPVGNPSPVSLSTLSSAGFTTGKSDCFEAGSSQLVDPHSKYTCDTGVSWPSVGKDLYLVIQMKDADKSWEYKCTVQTSGAISC